MKNGYSTGKALTGVIVAGVVGLAGGLIGSNKIKFVCNKCRKKW